MIRRRILSYLLTNVHRTIQICVHHHTTRLADIQATLHTIRVVLSPTTRIRPARVSLTLAVNKDVVFLRLVFKQRGEPIELPTVQFPDFPACPSFQASPFSSYRISLESPIEVRPTLWSIHCSIMCLARTCRKWFSDARASVGHERTT